MKDRRNHEVLWMEDGTAWAFFLDGKIYRAKEYDLGSALDLLELTSPNVAAQPFTKNGES